MTSLQFVILFFLSIYSLTFINGYRLSKSKSYTTLYHLGKTKITTSSNKLRSMKTNMKFDSSTTESSESVQSSYALSSFSVPSQILSSVILFSFAAQVMAEESSVDTTLIFAAKPVLDLFINIMNLLFLSRVIISWYPKTNKEKFPFNAIIWPTEPLLVPVRSLIPPAFGVDISAIVWIMLLSFLREILTGPQGILSLMESS